MSTTDELLANNASYAASFASRSPGDQESPGSLPLKPSKHLAVVACMDARIDVHKIRGWPRATPTSSATPAGSSPTMSSVRSWSRSARAGRRRSC